MTIVWLLRGEGMWRMRGRMLTEGFGVVNQGEIA